MSLITAKRLWSTVHLWIALTLGLFVALAGLSGALLVLKGPLLTHDFGAAAFAAGPPPEGAPGVDGWAAAAQARQPAGQIVSIAAPGASPIPTQAVLVSMALSDGGFGFVTVDPATSRAVGFFRYGEGSLFKVLDFHRNLLLAGRLEPVGDGIMIAAGVALLVSAGTGLWLWFPRGWWRGALRFEAGSKSLHRTLGALAGIPLLTLAASGLALALALGSLSKPAPIILSLKGEGICRPLKGYDDGLRSAMSAAQAIGFTQLSRSPAGDLRARVKTSRGELDVQVDGHCGRVVSTAQPVSNFDNLATGWHRSLLLGPVGSTLVFVLGLSLPALYGLGLWSWLSRRRKTVGA